MSGRQGDDYDEEIRDRLMDTDLARAVGGERIPDTVGRLSGANIAASAGKRPVSHSSPHQHVKHPNTSNEGATMETLIVTHPSIGRREVALERGKSYTLGRKRCDVLLDFEERASRQHAKLDFIDGVWKLTDQMSSNGTAVGGQKVNFAVMQPGVLAQIGKTTLEVLAPQPVQRDAVSGRPGKKVRSGRASSRRQPAAPEAPHHASGRMVSPPSGRRASAAAAVISAPRRSKAPVFIAAAVLVCVLGAVAAVIAARKAPLPADNGAEQSPLVSQAGEHASDLALRAELDDIAAIKSPEQRREQLHAMRGRNQHALAISNVHAYWEELEQRAMAEIRKEVETLRSELMPKAEALRAADRFKDAAAVIDGYVRLHNGRNSFWQDQAMTLRGEALAFKLALEQASREQMQVEVLRAENQFELGNKEAALALLRGVLENALLDETGQKWIERKIRDFEQRTPETSFLPGSIIGGEEGPVKPLKNPADLLSKLRPAKTLKLPDTNPLLPDGKASEAALIDALYERIRADIAAKKLKQGGLWHQGGKEVRVIGATETGIKVVRSGGGDDEGLTETVKWSSIVPQDYLKLLERMGSKEKGTLLAVALLGFNRGEIREASRVLVELYNLDNSTKEGIDILIATKRKIGLPEGGFVIFDGEFVAPEEQSDIVLQRQLDALLDEFRAGLGKSGKAREASDIAYAKLMAFGPRAIAPALQLLEAERQKAMAEAEGATGLLSDTAELKRLKEELHKRRKHALDLIFDTAAWPYPYGPNDLAVRADVATRVGAVRDIWINPVSIKGRINPQFQAIMEKIRDINARMDQIDAAEEYHHSTSATDMAYLDQVANKALDVKNYALDKGEKALIVYNATIMRENEDKQKVYAGKKGCPDAEAWEQLRITNDYRMMMGRNALKMNFKLYWGAYFHSQYCVEHNNGTIAHVIPGEPRGASPGERMVYEGYRGPGGENIHMHSIGPTAQSAHDSWLSSSGHHRNVLNEMWRVQGNGKFTIIWTQLFGATDEGEGNYVSRGGE